MKTAAKTSTSQGPYARRLHPMFESSIVFAGIVIGLIVAVGGFIYTLRN